MVLTPPSRHPAMAFILPTKLIALFKTTPHCSSTFGRDYRFPRGHSRYQRTVSYYSSSGNLLYGKYWSYCHTANSTVAHTMVNNHTPKCQYTAYSRTNLT